MHRELLNMHDHEERERERVMSGAVPSHLSIRIRSRRRVSACSSVSRIYVTDKIQGAARAAPLQSCNKLTANCGEIIASNERFVRLIIAREAPTIFKHAESCLESALYAFQTEQTNARRERVAIVEVRMPRRVT